MPLPSIISRIRKLSFMSYIIEKKFICRRFERPLIGKRDLIGTIYVNDFFRLSSFSLEIIADRSRDSQKFQNFV